MSLLFNDPLAFLPASESPGGANSNGLRMLFHNWNQTQSAGGTFNHQPQENVIQQQRQLDQLGEIKARMEQMQQTGPVVASADRSIHARRIKQPQDSSQLLEPIPVMDLDHPLNSWMLPNRNSQHLGPLATNNNSDWPILPKFTVSALSNGTLVQIPILWTAMSMAMGLEIRGDIIRGLPCIKRLNQLFCPTAGNRYPGDPIEKFIDENKALIRRMYGEFQTPAPTSTNGGAAASNRRSVRHSTSPDKGSANSDWHFRDSELFAEDLEADGSSIFGGGFLADGQNRTRRQTNNRNTNKEKDNKSDACESTVEVVTPYWAANSSGKIRAIVNTQHFEQAVHQEVCSKPRTGRCNGDCSCEQKYKWHRLLAYDPDNDCKGIFMDWFLFPSCCVCRCAPL
ncbi:protein spaetzle 3-like [Daphnia carinata]|uniref:protein spaetzle 3-like n=1 Tax=Daphnia carinata TaxID=120202 RepID=UPI00257D9AA0|nr:protein spaetzle 3-like [Daphnia carinata]